MVTSNAGIGAPSPVRRGDAGPLVIDLRRRLRSLGFDPGTDDDRFDLDAEAALRRFQEARGLDPDGRCGPQTWAALAEASFTLGSRLLCLSRPMTRGDDVAELQLRLGALGFDPGTTDGIFGPNTERALGEFQRNAGIVADQICGPETVAALRRLATRGSNISIAGLREREELRGRTTELAGYRVALCHLDGHDHLVGPIGVELTRMGATVAVIVDEGWSAVAANVNRFEAQLCLAVMLTDEPTCEFSYFATDGFESAGGYRLASLLAVEVPTDPQRTAAVVHPRRIDILRETRCPTVRWRVGDAEAVATTAPLLASGACRAVQRWVTEAPG